MGAQKIKWFWLIILQSKLCCILKFYLVSNGTLDLAHTVALVPRFSCNVRSYHKAHHELDNCVSLFYVKQGGAPHSSTTSDLAGERTWAWGKLIARTFLGSFHGAPIGDSLQAIFGSLHMPHIENPHFFIALHFLFPFIGVLFLTSLIEFLTLFNFCFDFNLSLHVNI